MATAQQYCPVCNAIILCQNGMRQCSSCGRVPPPFPVASTFTQPQGGVRRANGMWECPTCKRFSPDNVTTCPICGYQSLPTPTFNQVPPYNPVSLPPAPQPDPSIWQCPQCSYSYNLKSLKNCQRCNNPQPGFVGGGQGPGALLPSQQSGAIWGCVCGYSYNTNQTCLHCQRPNPNLPPSASIPSTPKWQCQQCGSFTLSANPFCNSCGAGKPTGGTVREIKCTVKINGKNWVCEQCGFDRNWAEFNRCKNCQTMNIVGKKLAGEL